MDSWPFDTICRSCFLGIHGFPFGSCAGGYTFDNLPDKQIRRQVSENITFDSIVSQVKPHPILQHSLFPLNIYAAHTTKGRAKIEVTGVDHRFFLSAGAMYAMCRMFFCWSFNWGGWTAVHRPQRWDCVCWEHLLKIGECPDDCAETAQGKGHRRNSHGKYWGI